MENLRPDEELEAKEFEEATRDKWQRPQLPRMPNLPSRPRLPSGLRLPGGKSKWLIGIVVVVALIFGGRWLHHELKGNQSNPQTPPPATATTNSPQPQASASTAPTNSGAQAQSSGQVPNTGPGDTAAIFLAATLAAGLAHYLVSSRKTR